MPQLHANLGVCACALQKPSSLCLADVCTALHCDFFTSFVAGHVGYGFNADAPCREAVVSKHRRLCEVCGFLDFRNQLSGFVVDAPCRKAVVSKHRQLCEVRMIDLGSGFEAVMCREAVVNKHWRLCEVQAPGSSQWLSCETLQSHSAFWFSLLQLLRHALVSSSQQSVMPRWLFSCSGISPQRHAVVAAIIAKLRMLRSQEVANTCFPPEQGEEAKKLHGAPHHQGTMCRFLGSKGMMVQVLTIMIILAGFSLCRGADYVMNSLCKAHTCHTATHRQMLRKIVKARLQQSSTCSACNRCSGRRRHGRFLSHIQPEQPAVSECVLKQHTCSAGLANE